MKNTTKLTLFSTVLVTAAIVFMYIMLISEINNDMIAKGLTDTYRYLSLELFLILVLTLVLAYAISSVLIDQILNPIRLMITKIKEVERMNFTSPLVIKSMDDDLKEYAEAFNSMSQHLSGYIERQKRFISDASHELATPITIINGYTDMLLRRGKEQPELLNNGLEVIRMEVLRMNELVDSLLMLARSDSGKQVYTFEQHDLTVLLNESISEIKLIEPDFTIEADLSAGLALLCDAYAIRRVIRILLSNAVKYADGCKMESYTSHGLVYVIIRDEGIGIAAEHLPRLFDRFYRVDDSRTKKTGSSGLGLAIAQEIVRAHGGEIEVTSEVGKGTAFTVILPS